MTNRIFKGHIAKDTWFDRIEFSKKAPVLGTSFVCSEVTLPDGSPLKIKLIFWDSLDAQPCFSIEDELSADFSWPSELTMKPDDSSEPIVFTSMTEVTDDMTEAIESGRFAEVISRTKMYYAIR